MTKGKGKTPGFGNLDKHLKQKHHGERGQLASRKHLGGLEKHKDYVHRAKRRHDRVAKVKQLKRAAALKNEDEFNMKMTQYVMDLATGKMKRKDAKGKKELLQEELTRNTKNLLYLDHTARQDRKKVEDLVVDVAGFAVPVSIDETGGEDDGFGLAGGSGILRQNKHTLFVDDDNEASAPSKMIQRVRTAAALSEPERKGKGKQPRIATPEEAALLHATQTFETTPGMLRKVPSLFRPRLSMLATRAVAEEEEPVAAVQRAVNAAEEGNEEEEDGDAPTPASPSPNDVATWTAAKKAREIVERTKRAARLEKLSHEVKKRCATVKDMMTRRRKPQYAKGTTVRSR